MRTNYPESEMDLPTSMLLRLSNCHCNFSTVALQLPMPLSGLYFPAANAWATETLFVSLNKNVENHS